jgi:hypothetical protein
VVYNQTRDGTGRRHALRELALMKRPVDNRDVDWITLKVFREGLDRIRELMAAFRRRVGEVAMEYPESETEYRLDLRLLPTSP